MHDLILVLCAAAVGAFLTHIAHCHAWKMYREGKKEGQRWRVECDAEMLRGARK